MWPETIAASVAAGVVVGPGLLAHRQQRGDLLERPAGLAQRQDEVQAVELARREQAVPAAAAGRLQQALALVVADGAGRAAAARGHVLQGEEAAALARHGAA
jgi:hypothetical protein